MGPVGNKSIFIIDRGTYLKGEKGSTMYALVITKTTTVFMSDIPDFHKSFNVLYVTMSDPSFMRGSDQH